MPNDKCDSHDDCFKRLYGKVEVMDGKLDRFMEEIRNRLHDGDLRFKELEMRFREFEMRLAQSEKALAHEVDARLVEISMRLAPCEKALAERSSGHSDVKQKLIASAIDILKLAIIGIGSAAVWAFANGYHVQ